MPPVLQRLIQPPRLRSEDGLEPGRRVTWMELFFDLIFVAAVAQVGTHLRDDYSPAGLLRFSLLFVMIWWSWLGHTNFSTRFDTDDLIQRSLTALQIFLVAVMAINATGPLDGRDSAGFVAAYAAMRFSPGRCSTFGSGESCGHEPSPHATHRRQRSRRCSGWSRVSSRRQGDSGSGRSR